MKYLFFLLLGVLVGRLAKPLCLRWGITSPWKQLSISAALVVVLTAAVLAGVFAYAGLGPADW